MFLFGALIFGHYEENGPRLCGSNDKPIQSMSALAMYERFRKLKTKCRPFVSLPKREPAGGIEIPPLALH